MVNTKSDKVFNFRRRTLQNVSPQNKPNAGLWLDKYLRDNDDGSIAALFEELGRIQIPDNYPRAFEARNGLLNVPAQPEFIVQTKTAEVDGRMIVGLGQRGVTEAGITLEHTWGVPMIPGSSLKGIAAWAARQCGENWWHADENLPGDYFLALFGGPDSEDDDSSAKGCVTFHDAWWNPLVRGEKEKTSNTLPIHLDIMTVHHTDYYAGKNKLPSDMDSPTPIPFGSVNGAFDVILEGPEDWVREAFALLALGLEQHGIGAKTAGGYGRLKFKLSEEEAKQKQIAEEAEQKLQKEKIAEEKTLQYLDQDLELDLKRIPKLSAGNINVTAEELIRKYEKYPEAFNKIKAEFKKHHKDLLKRNKGKPWADKLRAE